jgi:PAS domain S-box-containing protein
MSLRPSEPINFQTDAERLHLLVDAVTEYAIYMLDLDGFVTTWNTGAERLKGYTAAEVLGKHYSSFFSVEDQQRDLPAEILRRATDNGRHETEGWRVRKDGTRFWASAIVHKVHDKQGRHIGFAKVARDLTEERAAREALLESERRFRILVQGVTDYAIYMLDPSGIVTNWNAGAERIEGYTAAEIVGQHISRFYSWEDRTAGLPARALTIAAREGRYEGEGWRIRKDGSRYWATVVVDAIHDDAGKLIGFAKITRDTTEQRKQQEHLRDSERQFRLLVNGVTDYALYMLDLNGIVTNWNPGAQRIKGYTVEEIVGQHFSKFYTESDRAAGLPARALHTASTQGRFEADSWRVRKDGSVFWANVIIDPIKDEQGKLIGFSKITRDITERHEAQKAMEATQAQLAQVQKMEAVGQLTGGVAHDFNNLLMIVSSYIPAIKRLAANDPKGMRAAEAIELAAQRGATLTRQLLSFSRRQSLNPEVIRLDEVVEAARPILTSVLGVSVTCVTMILPDVWPIRVDVSELELAIINLIVNARDAMSNGGTVSVAAENMRLGPGDFDVGLEGDFVALTVADTGQGIPPDILAKVFDPFFTTKETGKGTGLGLSQVHGFVHQSGGTVSIKSKMGQGTRVILFLPRAQEEIATDTASNAPPAHAAGRKVLLVEDNPEVAEATRELLARMGCVVETAGNAEAALRALDQGEFDLVLSDIVMAGSQNGLDLARVIRERRPGFPVILATGYSEAESQAGGEFMVLRKPYDASDLNKALTVLDERGPAKVVEFPGPRHGRRSPAKPE